MNSAPFDNIKENWEVALTMVFGSFIAGATSEGGGAVAFPIFTKVLHISPTDAKVFSLAIQSVGMTAASLVILFMGIKLERRVVRWASIGGIPGILVGTGYLASNFPPAIIKISFTAMVTSFAVTLLILNRGGRLCHRELTIFTVKEKSLLLMFGFVGGVMSGLVGNGIDIITFSLIVLLFRLSEKVATPTSVVLMAINAVVGFCCHLFWLGGFTPVVEGYWLAAVPIVVVGAPIGAICCALLSRKVIVSVLIGLIAVELVTSLLIIPLSQAVILSGLATLFCFSGAYYLMSRTTFYEPEITGIPLLSKVGR